MEVKMKEIEKKELVAIIGGGSISGAVLNAFLNIGKFVYSLGQSFGSSLRRISSNKVCSCK